MPSNYPPGMTTGYMGVDICEVTCPTCRTKYGLRFEGELGGWFPIGPSEDVLGQCPLCGDDAIADQTAGDPSVPVPQGPPYKCGWDEDTNQPYMCTDDLTYVVLLGWSPRAWATEEDLQKLIWDWAEENQAQEGEDGHA